LYKDTNLLKLCNYIEITKKNFFSSAKLILLFQKSLLDANAKLAGLAMVYFVLLIG
jgi:hypothetical protein